MWVAPIARCESTTGMRNFLATVRKHRALPFLPEVSGCNRVSSLTSLQALCVRGCHQVAARYDCNLVFVDVLKPHLFSVVPIHPRLPWHYIAITIHLRHIYVLGGNWLPTSFQLWWYVWVFFFFFFDKRRYGCNASVASGCMSRHMYLSFHGREQGWIL